MPNNPFTDPARAGIYHLPPGRRAQVKTLATLAHLDYLEANAGGGKEIAQVLASFGHSLHFPAWYGANLDALHDCLADPDWQAGPGTALVISGLDGLHARDPDAFSTLIEVLGAAAASRSAAGQALWILLTDPARGVPPLPDA